MSTHTETYTTMFNRCNPETAELRRVSTEGFTSSVADNFVLGEFQSHDGTDILLLHPRLIELCQNVRDHFDAPANVNSGFRTNAHNADIGGASQSKHLLGMAADLDVAGVPPEEVASFAESLEVGGMGRYNSFTHLDVFGYRRRWDFR
jgi:uncharacterized protein YcbK (DUF882 family)